MIRRVAGFLVYASVAAGGQSPRFEVASVKPAAADLAAGQSGGSSGRGRLTMSNVTLKRCIMGAYGIGPNRIFSGPEWLDSERFEIAARAAQPVGDGALMEMLQTLLAERFKLAVHRETRTVEAFVLEVARNGPKLRKAAGEDAATHNGRGLIDAQAITMDRFAEVLSRQMDSPVVNRTGLADAFDLKLEWARDGSGPADPELSLFTAIQQQLGLRLRSQKTGVEVLAIDHAERPAEN